MSRLTFAAPVVLATLIACGGPEGATTTGDATASTSSSISGNVPFDACWGQAVNAFAHLQPAGTFGEHVSSQTEPREGLKNAAQALFEAGEIPEPTLAALGAYLSAQLGLSIDACL